MVHNSNSALATLPGVANRESLVDALNAGLLTDEVLSWMGSFTATALAFATRQNRLYGTLEAEDIVQDFWVRFIRIIESKRLVINDLAHLRALCHRMLRMELIDAYRRHFSGPIASIEEAVNVAERPLLDIDALLEMDRLLNLLGADDRKIIELRFFSGYTAREVGALLDLSETAARVRIHRALKRLKALAKFQRASV